LFTIEGGGRCFSRANIDELDDRQKSRAIASAENLIDTLNDLIDELKRA
jgi:hypothetical protein